MSAADLEATVADSDISLSDLEDSPESATYVKSWCFITSLHLFLLG